MKVAPKLLPGRRAAGQAQPQRDSTKPNQLELPKPGSNPAKPNPACNCTQSLPQQSREKRRMTEKEAPPDMDALSLDSGDEGVMIGDKEDMFASALGDPPQVYLIPLQLQ